MKLYAYWRSSCSWRVRIGLELKGIDYEVAPVNLVREGGENNADSYKVLNPMAQVPTLEVPGAAGQSPRRLVQSLAILEWLDESYPEPSLLPGDANQRVLIRECAEIVNAGIQPLQNLPVLKTLAGVGIDKKAWCADVIGRGLASLEALVAGSDTRFLCADQPTLADICLIPQLYNARRFDVDLSSFGRILSAEAACENLEAFTKAHPDRQPDAPASP